MGGGHVMEYYPAIKKNKLLPHTPTRNIGKVARHEPQLYDSFI